jgi:hypothetical protein
MNKRLLFLLGLAALVGVLWRRRRRPATELQVPDPADELRRKLDEARESEIVSDLTEDLDERRRSVHERARSAAEEMHSPSTD